MSTHNVIWLDAWSLRRGRSGLTPEERWKIHREKWVRRALRICEIAVATHDRRRYGQASRLLRQIHERQVAGDDVARLAAELARMANAA